MAALRGGPEGASCKAQTWVRLGICPRSGGQESCAEAPVRSRGCLLPSARHTLTATPVGQGRGPKPSGVRPHPTNPQEVTPPTPFCVSTTHQAAGVVSQRDPAWPGTMAPALAHGGWREPQECARSASLGRGAAGSAGSCARKRPQEDVPSP